MDILSFIMGLKKGKSSVKLQEKTVTPSESEVVVVPDEAYDALSKVIVSAVQSSGGGSGEWISATGSFTPTGTTYVLNHNLGVVPDIFFVYYFDTSALTGSNSLLMCGMVLSKKLLGDASSSGTGYSFLFNPNTKIPYIVSISGGIEGQSAGNLSGIGGATAAQISLGSSLANLIANKGEYNWTAHAMK